MSSSCCNEREWRKIDFSVMPNLRELRVEDDCFENVEEVKIIGMKKLERIGIGENCFSRNSVNSVDERRQFCLRECDELKELKIGSGSFYSFSRCTITHSNVLEVIDLGNGNCGRGTFYSASLTLMSDDHVF